MKQVNSRPNIKTYRILILVMTLVVIIVTVSDQLTSKLIRSRRSILPDGNFTYLHEKYNEDPAPWFVTIRTGRGVCGGTIISLKIVLTAAHCLYPQRYSTIDIFYNKYRPFFLRRLIPRFPDHSTRLFIIHPDYFNNSAFTTIPGDIALIKLSDGDFFDQNIRLARLPTSQHLEFHEKSKQPIYRTIGYGQVAKTEINPLKYHEALDFYHINTRQISFRKDFPHLFNDSLPVKEFIGLKPATTLNYFDSKILSDEECLNLYLRKKYKKSLKIYGNPDNFPETIGPDWYEYLPSYTKKLIKEKYGTKLLENAYGWKSTRPRLEKMFSNDPSTSCFTSIKNNSGQTTCYGDSGSPVLILDQNLKMTDVIIGVVSSSYDDNCMSSTKDNNIINLNTNVTYYVPWIKKMMNNSDHENWTIAKPPDKSVDSPWKFSIYDKLYLKAIYCLIIVILLIIFDENDSEEQINDQVNP